MFLFSFSVLVLWSRLHNWVFSWKMGLFLHLCPCSSSLLPFLGDSLILCPSYGLRVSPHFIDSVGALPYPSLQLHSAWPIPIRQRPCHEQKSCCDQVCIQPPMSLLALAAPARCSTTVWTGLRFVSAVISGRVWPLWVIETRVWTAKLSLKRLKCQAATLQSTNNYCGTALTNYFKDYFSWRALIIWSSVSSSRLQIVPPRRL